jgi:membrane fusion protein (multidrug efflux system)
MSDAAPHPATTEPPPATPLFQRRWLLAAALITFSLLLGLYFLLPDLIAARTDDAYVEAHVELISARVPGHVLTLHVDDNSAVKKGEVMLELDPRDFEVKVEAAQANLAAAQSRFAEAKSQTAIAATQIAVADAEAEAANANARLAAADLKRFQGVSDVRAVSSERLDTAKAAADSSHATMDAARTKVDLARNQADLARVQQTTAEASVAQAKAALDQAELDFSYAHVTAPEAGTVANKLVETGNYVQPGQTLLSLVPTVVYVVANFKETQIEDIGPGSHATIRVDSFPDLRLRGHVESIQRGSGARFALLPPENATGNFVKIVQRIPVKILLDEPPETLAKLAPGMSVIVSVSSP